MPRRFVPLTLLLAGCLDSYDPASTTTSDADPTRSTTDAAPTTGEAPTTTSTTTTTGESPTTTTATPPVCGDGTLDLATEECDDGNLVPDDGCDDACHRDRYVFATSELFSPNWLGGIKPADDICKQLANKADLANPFTFTAWLSDSQSNAIDRLYPGQGRYLRPDGVVVALGAQQFTSGTLLAPIQTDEYGEPLVAEYAWTGTRVDGVVVPGADNCSDWTSKHLLQKGYIGDISSLNERWTFVPDPEINPTPCPLDLHLYCIEGK